MSEMNDSPTDVFDDLKSLEYQIPASSPRPRSEPACSPLCRDRWLLRAALAFMAGDKATSRGSYAQGGQSRQIAFDMAAQFLGEAEVRGLQFECDRHE